MGHWMRVRAMGFMRDRLLLLGLAALVDGTPTLAPTPGHASPAPSSSCVDLADAMYGASMCAEWLVQPWLSCGSEYFAAGGVLEGLCDYTCDFCAAGKAFVNKQSNCSVCLLGQYQDQDANQPNVSCQTCGKGEYATNSITSCTACETGKFQELDVAAEHSCKFCAAGTEFVDTQSACTACLQGKYQSQNTLAEATCQTCGVGQFAVSATQACTLCDEGKYQEASAATDYACKFCAAGKAFVDKENSCSICDSGRYQDQDSTHPGVSCQTCGKGQYAVNSRVECKA